jgi:hypothetical protein
VETGLGAMRALRELGGPEDVIGRASAKRDEFSAGRPARIRCGYLHPIYPGRKIPWLGEDARILQRTILNFVRPTSP